MADRAMAWAARVFAILGLLHDALRFGAGQIRTMLKRRGCHLVCGEKEQHQCDG